MGETKENERYIYRLRRHIDINDVQDTLTLAVLSTENLHGRARVRLDGWWRLDRQRRLCSIDASTAVGQDIARLFAGFLAQEFGERAFTVQRPARTAEAGRP
jgi:hypothetical protein